MTNKSKPKPPPIVIDMHGSGIEPEAVTFGETQQVFKYDWRFLIGFPPFQMFVQEQSTQSIDNVDDWIIDFLVEKLNAQGEDLYFSEYSVWHKSKGFWKNETEFGELKG
ncbi:hypothetical protein [Acinetobacter bereziniae]|uniref:hypothetical protein n=1 Tax=Acinetobacter bereziniae TaxID=106648 RepID=UPI00124FA60C|nr:hypothetical protein [Acinetobacter bereziniae]